MAKTKRIGRWTVRVVFRGDKYGLRRCQTHGEKYPMAEFYDSKYAGKKGFDREGQFVSRYYASTLMGDVKKIAERGLDLQGDVPAWKVNAPDARTALRFIAEAVPGNLQMEYGKNPGKRTR